MHHARTFLAAISPRIAYYGLAVVTAAGASLQDGINTLAAAANPNLAVEIKTDPLGA